MRKYKNTEQLKEQINNIIEKVKNSIATDEEKNEFIVLIHNLVKDTEDFNKLYDSLIDLSKNHFPIFEFRMKLRKVTNELKLNGEITTKLNKDESNPNYNFLKNNYDKIMAYSKLNDASEEVVNSKFIVDNVPLFKYENHEDLLEQKLKLLYQMVNVNNGVVPYYLFQDDSSDKRKINPLYTFMKDYRNYIENKAIKDDCYAKFIVQKANYFNKIDNEEKYLDNLMQIHEILSDPAQELKKYDLNGARNYLYNFLTRNKSKIIKYAASGILKSSEDQSYIEKVSIVLMSHTDCFINIANYSEFLDAKAIFMSEDFRFPIEEEKHK